MGLSEACLVYFLTPQTFQASAVSMPHARYDANGCAAAAFLRVNMHQKKDTPHGLARHPTLMLVPSTGGFVSDSPKGLEEVLLIITFYTLILVEN